MRVRLFALVLVASLCGTGFVRVTRDEAPARTRAAASAPGPAAATCPIPTALRPAFVAAARETGLPLALLVAVGEFESGLRVDAVSRAGARGPLQLMPATAAELSVDPTRPQANVLGGARYLRAQLDRFHSTALALSAYNAGPTAVTRAGGAPSGETLTYVANVTGRWRELVGCA